MLDAIKVIRDVIQGLDLATYEAPQSVGQRRAVERCIEIVSEASRHLPIDLIDQHPEVPWRAIRDIGNVLRHGYAHVDNKMIWKVASSDVLDLEPALHRILASLPLDPED